MKNLVIILVVIFCVSCNKESGGNGEKLAVNSDDKGQVEVVVPEVPVTKVYWYAVSPDNVYTHVGGRVEMKCWGDRCEIMEMSIHQYFINTMNIKHLSYGSSGELFYDPEKDVSYANMRRATGEEGVTMILRNGLPHMLKSMSECLLFGEMSEDRFYFDQMIEGKTNYSYSNPFMPYDYGLDLDSPECDY